MTKQEQFFYDNAGYSVAKGETTEQGHKRSARELAKAEVWAVVNGYSFYISPDPDTDESFMDDIGDTPAEVADYKAEWSGTAWQTLMYDESGKVVQSLGGSYGDSKYERVVKAELALEQMASVLKNSEVTL